jgi:hypothetical protein
MNKIEKETNDFQIFIKSIFARKNYLDYKSYNPKSRLSESQYNRAKLLCAHIYNLSCTETNIVLEKAEIDHRYIPEAERIIRQQYTDWE